MPCTISVKERLIYKQVIKRNKESTFQRITIGQYKRPNITLDYNLLLVSAKTPSQSFRKAERTAKGTLLVSSLVRNLLNDNPLADYGQQSSQRSPFCIACYD